MTASAESSGENAIPMNKIRIPTKAYHVRVMDVEKKKSKAGNDMFVMTFEIFNANPIVQDGIPVDINGIKVTHWASLSPKAIRMLNVMHGALGLARVKEEQLGSLVADSYQGAEGYAVIRSELDELKDEVTGEKVLHPYTNKPMFRFTRRITEFVEPEAEVSQF